MLQPHRATTLMSEDPVIIDVGIWYLMIFFVLWYFNTWYLCCCAVITESPGGDCDGKMKSIPASHYLFHSNYFDWHYHRCHLPLAPYLFSSCTSPIESISSSIRPYPGRQISFLEWTRRASWSPSNFVNLGCNGFGPCSVSYVLVPCIRKHTFTISDSADEADSSRWVLCIPEMRLVARRDGSVIYKVECNLSHSTVLIPSL